MVMLCRKIFHKLNGNYTFLIITDRDDLDRQIYRNFLNTGVTTEKQSSRPKNGQQLRDFLGSNKRYIFTLIQNSVTRPVSLIRCYQSGMTSSSLSMKRTARNTAAWQKTCVKHCRMHNTWLLPVPAIGKR